MVAPAATEPVLAQVAGTGFSITHQSILLDVFIESRSLKGKTLITVVPESENLTSIQLNCRQCKISQITVNDKQPSAWTYHNPYEETTLHGIVGVNQYHLLEQKCSDAEDLVIHLPKSVKVEPMDPTSTDAPSIVPSKSVNATKKDVAEDSAVDLSQPIKPSMDQVLRFKPLYVYISWTINEVREGLNFVGWEEGDLRYPHAYTTGNPQCLFPCVDTLASRCTWEVKIGCAATLGHLNKSMLKDTLEEIDLESQDLCIIAPGEEEPLIGEDYASEASVVSSEKLQFDFNVSIFQSFLT